MRLLVLKTVLVATDLSESAATALRTGQLIAESAGADLHVVHVTAASTSQESAGQMPELDASLRDTGIDPLQVNTHVVAGDPAHALNLLADKLGADVIIFGPHRQRGDAKSLLNNTVLSLVTNASVPCLVAPTVLRLPLRRVVVAIDLSDTARGALVTAVSWTSALRARDTDQGTTVTALRIQKAQRAEQAGDLGSPQLDQQLERVREEAGAWAGVIIETASRSNPDPAAGIAEYAREHTADLVVMGTRGLGLDATGRLGSVSASMMQRLDVPVLLVPPAVWAGYEPRRGD